MASGCIEPPCIKPLPQIFGAIKGKGDSQGQCGTQGPKGYFPTLGGCSRHLVIVILSCSQVKSNLPCTLFAQTLNLSSGIWQRLSQGYFSSVSIHLPPEEKLCSAIPRKKTVTLTPPWQGLFHCHERQLLLPQLRCQLCFAALCPCHHWLILKVPPECENWEKS